MRVGYADHAGVAGRRGYAPATQARCDGEGRDFTPNAVSKRVRAKLMPLPSYRKRFRSAVKVKPFGRASATLTEIEYPLLVKRVFAIPSPPPRLRQLAPDGHRRRCESAMPTTQASPAVGATRPLRRRAATGREGLHTKRSLQEGKGKTDALYPLIASVFSSAVKVKPFGAQARP